ncbi:glycosyltransferase family 2 protein [Roseicyclus sp. F158]|uniref:Glycosyltransferase family 2 protein n=1 Tax=Tropicimonas omnivorans TaxID=3075590 RepID=A0ABU3DJW5_9RHOB|nr:glycosyltransferase family 2 protein [Roseicyclus sp. F158]MDT0684005.1 glycosyltransferase family 2 protein [Roseicyclus sp. F158]
MSHDDLSVVSGAGLEGAPGFTVIAVMRNEMYFLPAFLDHYRKIGADRFIVVDDRSDDGSAEYLGAQHDVMLLRARGRYGDPVDGLAIDPRLKAGHLRRMHLWRSILMRRFCVGRWALQADLDEFIALPEGTTLPGVASRLEAEGVRGAWGVMLDVYPERLEELGPGAPAAKGVQEGRWLFDARRHLHLQSDGGTPKVAYAGARMRLYARHGLAPRPPLRRRLDARIRGVRTLTDLTLHKPTLAKFGPEDMFLHSHRATVPMSGRMLLPILHYRFTPALWSRVSYALESGAYAKGSSEYHQLSALLAALSETGEGFACRISKDAGDIAALRKSGNLLGLP